MDIMDIIKDSFVFPSKDLGKLAIYIVLSLVISGLVVGSGISSIFGLTDSMAYVGVGVVLFIIALILGFVLSGYNISIIKSGVDLDETAPDYSWKENLITGIKYLVLSVVYYIIPAIIVVIVAFLTNLPGNAYALINEFSANMINVNATVNATAPVVDTVSNVVMSNFATSLSIVGVVAIILFIIFSILESMGSGRLAKTDNLVESLNIVEAFKDIGRIGWGKVIATLIIVIVVVIVINFIVSLITQYVPAIGIVTIIIDPYLTFFVFRAIGLLYSDIA